MRKLATQVPSAVSRLFQSSLIVTPPTWYLPVSNNPPPLLPPRQTVRRKPSNEDLPPTHLDASREGLTKTHKMKHFRETKPRPAGIVYPEDRIRRQFFKDFPFEALRAVSMAEKRDIRPEEEGTSGKEWMSLAQRGEYPTVENVIAFTLSIHHHHHKPLAEAYAFATAEFIELRARHEMATIAAEMEARAHGATFGQNAFERWNRLEGNVLDTLATSSVLAATSTSKAKFRKPARWTATAPGLDDSEFSAGKSYVQKWTLPAPVDAPGDSPLEASTEESSKDGDESLDALLKETPEEERMSEEELLDSSIRPREEVSVPVGQSASS